MERMFHKKAKAAWQYIRAHATL